MANLQESILQAVDTLVQNRVAGIEADKTVIATIVACSNAFTREYKVSYNGGYMVAYAQEGATYSTNAAVYVLVPQGDFTQKKTIIGKTQSIEDDENISFVSSALSDYNMIGANCIKDKNNATPTGLNSYYKNDYALLYKHGDVEHQKQFVGIDADILENNLLEAEVILIEASFMTRLPKAHRYSSLGKYGLEFVLAFEDDSKDPISIVDRDYLISKSVSNDDLTAIDRISDAVQQLQTAWLDDAFIDQNFTTWKNNMIALQSNLNNAAAMSLVQEVKQATLQTKTAIDAIIKKMSAANSLNAIGYDCADIVLKYIYLPSKKDYGKDELAICTVKQVKYSSYVIDSNSMTGNPYNFNVYADQYAIFPIDTANFLYIDSILFYSQDFVDKDDAVNADMNGDDIFVKELEFYGLRKISAKNGEYVLSLSMPQGNTFKSILTTDSLKIVANVAQNININLSDTTTFYWLKQDSRIDSSQAFPYAGKGWRLLDVGHNYSCKIYANNNMAFENKYLCIAIYHDELILKEEFVLYNNAVKRDLTITSSLGTKFSFDRGIPELTCLVNGKEAGFEDGHPDKFFNFIWSKIATDGTVTIFNETKEDLEKRYKENIGKVSYSELSSIKNKIQQLEGVSWNQNKLTYPVKQITSQETFKCTVYLRDEEPSENQTIEDIEYMIGSPEITLLNEGVTQAKDYYIEITNGDQVFQYSETGIAPNSERYDNPQTIMPLSCKFYDPNGLEISSAAYDVKWRFPLINSMIVPPTINIRSNPANNKMEFCISQNYPLAILDNYNYNYTSNQIQCIVEYEGETYTQYTNLLFTKVGENGTNGTDIVARIDIDKVGLADDTLPALVVSNGKVTGWNTGKPLSSPVFKFQLYQRNEKLEARSINWAMAGGRTRFFDISDGILSYDNDATKNCFRTQIVKASTSWENTQYYAFYGFPVIQYNYGTDGKQLLNGRIEICDSNSLKFILYNANGYNPLYNKLQGIQLRIMDGQVNTISGYYIKYAAEGGMPNKVGSVYGNNPENPDFKLIPVANSKNGVRVLDSDNLEDNGLVYILPDDFYSGEYTNNLIHISIYENKADADKGGTPAAEVYYPVNMSLNTYELQSLNSWDGQHLEINEDENYILAPQIGAGEKDKNNKFTGVVMGKAQYYDEADAAGNLENSTSLGILGYSHGLQSIFLNAEDGSATFGLPQANSQQADNNSEREGRIKLVPGGVSTIANWHIGANSLYNISNNGKSYLSSDIGSKYSDLGNAYKVSIPSESEGVLLSSSPAYISVKSRMVDKDSNVDYTAANTIVQPYDSFELQLDPSQRSVFTVYRHTSAPENVLFTVWDNKLWLSTQLTATSNGYKKNDEAIQPLSEGILSSDKTKIIGWIARNKYSSRGTYVIARPLIDEQGNIQQDDWYFCSVNSSGSYYLPEYSDTTENNKQLYDNLVWHREAKVGINSQGRFYTNALKDSTTALNIGPLGGFGHNALENAYVGATFEVGTGDTGNSLIKFFTPMSQVNSKTGDLYISGATDTNNEYQRSFNFYMKDFSLYVDSNSHADTSKQKIQLNSSTFQFGYFPDNAADSMYFQMPLKDKNATTTMRLANNFKLWLPDSKNYNILGGSANIELNDSKGTFNFNCANTTSVVFDQDLNIKTNKNFNFETKKFKTNYIDNYIDITSKRMRQENGKDTAIPYLNLRLSENPSQRSYLNFDSGLDINTYNDSINITSTGGAKGIHLSAIPSFNDEANGVTLAMIPQTGGNSSFRLASPNGSIWSQFDIIQSGNQNYHAIGINPGVVTQFGIFNGTLPNAPDTSLQVAKDVVLTDGWFYGKQLRIITGDGISWNDNYQWVEEDFRWTKNQADYWNSWVTNGGWWNVRYNGDNGVNARINRAQQDANTGINNAATAQVTANTARTEVAQEKSWRESAIDNVWNSNVGINAKAQKTDVRTAGAKLQDAAKADSWENARDTILIAGNYLAGA